MRKACSTLQDTWFEKVFPPTLQACDNSLEVEACKAQMMRALQCGRAAHCLYFIIDTKDDQGPCHAGKKFFVVKNTERCVLH